MSQPPDLASYLLALPFALQERDATTASHCDRTRGLAHELGTKCGLSSRELHWLDLSAQLHDIGKIGVPDEVLYKRGPLDAAEWEQMRSHPQRGYNIVSAVPADHARTVADAVLYHHENFDGTGYPHGLRGEEIPMLARIVAIADAYDAIATPRPYHDARTHTAVMDILHAHAHKYDPFVMRQFDLCIADSSLRVAD